MIIYGEALVSDACIDIRTPAAEDVTPVEICHVFLHLVEVHECTHVSHGLVLRHFMNVHDGVVGTGVSQHSHEIFPLHGVGQTIGVDRLQLRIADLILKARDIVDVPTELTERRSGGGSSEAERVMPRWFVERDTERWKPLVVMTLHIIGRFLRQIGVSGCEMLVSDACPPGPSASFTLILQVSSRLGIMVFVFRSSKHIGRTFGFSLTFHQAPFATEVDGMFVRDELLDFESSTIDIVARIGTVEGFLHLATFFLRDRLAVRILVPGIVQINL